MTFDTRNLTDDQRSLANDIASSMEFGHEDTCAVHWEDDPDGCSCPLILSVASGLHGAGIVEVIRESGFDPKTSRGAYLNRLSFDPHPLLAPSEPLDVSALTVAIHNEFGGDAPGGCDHTVFRTCEEYAAAIAEDYETELTIRRRAAMTGHIVGDRFVSDESFDAAIPLPEEEA